MNYVLCIFFIVIGICSCNSKPQPNDNINDLLAIDSAVMKYPFLNQFTNFCVSRKNINGIAVCDSVSSKCRPEERHYTTILDSIDVPVDVFDLITVKLCNIGFKTYYRYGDYSVWVENGAFGDIYGYLINHNPAVDEVKSFELDKRYHIGIGKEVRKNVYYFSSNYD